MKEERKNNTGLVVVIAVLVVAVIGLCGYIFLNNNNSNKLDSKNSSNVSEDKVNINAAENNSDETSNNKGPEISFVELQNGTAIVNNGLVYVNISGFATHEMDELFVEGTYQIFVSTSEKYKEYIIDNFKYNNGNFVGLKLNTDHVTTVYPYMYGQVMPSNYGLILLNEDKTLSMISLYSLICGKTDVKTINGLSNIEKVVTEGTNGYTTYAVNAKGEKINLSNYIPTDYKQF